MVTTNIVGTWEVATGSDSSKPVTELIGTKTKQISWGKPFIKGDRPSSYVFEGKSSVEIPTDGSPFELGEFKHLNYKIVADNPLAAATLKIEFQGTIEGAFNLKFEHDETPDPEKSTGEPDIVSISDLEVVDPVEIDGKKYQLSFEGFLDKDSNTQRKQFVTAEEKDNVTTLIGKLGMMTPEPEEPEPGKPEPGKPEPGKPIQPQPGGYPMLVYPSAYPYYAGTYPYPCTPGYPYAGGYPYGGTYPYPCTPGYPYAGGYPYGGTYPYPCTPGYPYSMPYSYVLVQGTCPPETEQSKGS